MRTRIGQTDLDMARDCFLLAATVMDMQCDLTKTMTALRRKDHHAASSHLRGVMKKSVRLERLHPGVAPHSKDIRRRAKELAAEIRETRRDRFAAAALDNSVANLLGRLRTIYASVRTRCAVP